MLCYSCSFAGRQHHRHKGLTPGADCRITINAVTCTYPQVFSELAALPQTICRNTVCKGTTVFPGLGFLFLGCRRGGTLRNQAVLLRIFSVNARGCLFQLIPALLLVALAYARAPAAWQGSKCTFGGQELGVPPHVV